jgi:hypothetical protein
MTTTRDIGVTLAIAPSVRGFGYIVFETPEVAMDWGVKDVRKNKLRDSLLKARVLMHMLQPSVLILEDAHHEASRRSKRVTVLIDKLAALAKERGIAVVRYSREDVLACFARKGARTKDDIAAAVTKLVPELAVRLPRRRRIWESEHYSMGIFEAAALALTHFARLEEANSETKRVS